MPSIIVRTFTDPDDFAASFLGTNVEMTILGRGCFEAKAIRIDLGRLQVRRLSDSLPRIAHVADVAEQAIISFRTEPGPRLIRDGAEMLTPNITWRSSAASYFHKSDGLANWGSMSLPVEDMVSVGETAAGCGLTPPRDAMLITPPPAAMAKLQRIHAAAGDLAEKAPEIIANPDAARGLRSHRRREWSCNPCASCPIRPVSSGRIPRRGSCKEAGVSLRRWPSLCRSAEVHGSPLRARSPHHVTLRPTEPSDLHVFLLSSRGQVQFIEADLKTPLPRKVTFPDADKIRELARRGEAGRVRGETNVGACD